MRLDLDNLPHDTALLHRLVRDMAGLVEHRDDEIERLGQIIKQLQRAQYGRRSERLDPGQLALALEELDADIAEIVESRPEPVVAQSLKARSKPLPEHLVREERLLDIEGEDCTRCGSTLHPIGESVSEMLDWVPARLRAIRIRRPKYACRQCETVAQAPAPERIIAGGMATPALLSHVLISKYCDHLPLYAQLIKIYGNAPDSFKGRYSPADCTGTRKRSVEGRPDKNLVSTSCVERANLTMRMHMRRFTRLTNGFSKKIDNHAHAVALHMMYYNFVRIHKSPIRKFFKRSSILQFCA